MGRFTCREITVKKKLSLCLNVESVTDDVTCDGRLFQVFAATTQNARSPTVRRRSCGTARSADDTERKRCRPGISATCCRLSVRNAGARVRPLAYPKGLPPPTLPPPSRRVPEAFNTFDTGQQYGISQEKQFIKLKLVRSLFRCSAVSSAGYLRHVQSIDIACSKLE